MTSRPAGAFTGREYTGASSVRARFGTSATTCPWSFTRSRVSGSTSPMRTACRSHFSKIRSTSASRPRLTMSSMRSCDSESMISYGVMPVSRCGTAARSISIPTPPREPVSDVEHVSPAAPMSWTPTQASVAMTSRHASSSSFSMNGSPTCTAGRFSADRSSNSAEAIVAPWMPSRPVFAPT